MEHTPETIEAPANAVPTYVQSTRESIAKVGGAITDIVDLSGDVAEQGSEATGTFLRNLIKPLRGLYDGIVGNRYK